eukprot:GEMP01023790.1.p1 GENE.GEMP01023790.1~~GEMP01023790.1.p1  ORF type:complete len:437 (+),score=84.82 GEMP01023790.1:60-1313(+)
MWRFITLALCVASESTEEPSTITVMLANVFFIPVFAPAVTNRIDGLSEWFASLSRTDVPDVLVFTEMWQDDLVKNLCSHTYSSNSGNITICDNDGSHFHAATPGVNAHSEDAPFWQLFHGGVVILTKKDIDLQWTPEWDLRFDAQVGGERLSKKGAQLVKITKDKKDTWVVGTHLQSNVNNTHTRQKQITQMAQHVHTYVPLQSNLVFAGDFNMEDVEMPFLAETLQMDSTNLVLDKFGFWMPANEPLMYSTIKGYGMDDMSPTTTDVQYDWIFPAALDDEQHLTRATAAPVPYQYVRLRGTKCFDVPGGAWLPKYVSVSDLSDHYAVFAQICFHQMQCTYKNVSAMSRGAQCDGEYLNWPLIFLLVVTALALIVLMIVAVTTISAHVRSARRKASHQNAYYQVVVQQEDACAKKEQ